MLKLEQYELDDIAREIDEIVAAQIRSGSIYAEVGADADEGDPADVRFYDISATGALLAKAVDRIYEICQTAHARELRKVSAAAAQNS